MKARSFRFTTFNQSSATNSGRGSLDPGTGIPLVFRDMSLLEPQTRDFSSKRRTKERNPKVRSATLAYRLVFRECFGVRAAGAPHITLKNKLLYGLVSVFLLVAAPIWAAEGTLTDDSTSSSDAIIAQYLLATQSQASQPAHGSIEIDISASVPKLKKQGRLRVLREISHVGQITYRVLGFQGDNTVKNQVIARYLQAEQQGQGKQDLAITPTNYKFKFRGERGVLGKDVYVFQLSPRHKKVGLFKGELWLSAANYLPVYEKGRLVKNPSIFFKKVDFERAFAIQNGAQVPAHMVSTIQTRLVGKVELEVNYLSPDSNPSGNVSSAEVETSSAALTSSN